MYMAEISLLACLVNNIESGTKDKLMCKISEHYLLNCQPC